MKGCGQASRARVHWGAGRREWLTLDAVPSRLVLRRHAERSLEEACRIALQNLAVTRISTKIAHRTWIEAVCSMRQSCLCIHDTRI